MRAYERRDDLRANNSRLIDYVRNGGTLIVQYNKFEFNEAQYGPHPAEVSSDRVTDENAPVRVLAPGHPILDDAERADRRGVERMGPGARAVLPGRERLAISRHRRDDGSVLRTIPAKSSARSWKPLMARGKWVYVGLGLWRELPAGVTGAYQLLANLLSYK